VQAQKFIDGHRDAIALNYQALPGGGVEVFICLWGCAFALSSTDDGLSQALEK
jgi:hypothetical protein